MGRNVRFENRISSIRTERDVTKSFSTAVYIGTFVVAWALASSEVAPAADASISNACETTLGSQAHSDVGYGYTLNDLCVAIVEARGTQILISSAHTKDFGNPKNQISIIVDGNHKEIIDSTLCAPSFSTKQAFSAPMLATVLSALDSLPATIRPLHVALSDFRVAGSISLAKASFSYSLRLEYVAFCGDVNIRDTHFHEPLEIHRSVIVSQDDSSLEGIINGIGATFDADVLIENSRVGGVLLARGRVAQTLSVSGSQMGFFSMRETSAGRMAALKTVQSETIAQRAESGLSSSNDPSIQPLPKPLFGSYFDIVEAVVSGEAYADHLHTDGPIASNLARFGNLRLKNANIFSADFRQIRVDENVDLAGTTIGRGQPSVDVGCNFERSQHEFVDYVAFRGADIGKHLLLIDYIPSSRSTPTQSSSTRVLCLNEMKIGGRLDFRGFRGNKIDLRHSEIGAGLVFADDHGTIWQPEVSDTELRLEHSDIGTLFLGTDTPLPAKTHLVGAKIGGVRLTKVMDNGTRRWIPATMAAKKVGEFLDRIDFDLMGREAYRVFQDAFRSLGESEAVDALRLAEENRVTENSTGLHWIVRCIANALGGYGLAPDRTARIALVLIVIGGLVFRFSKAGCSFLGGRDPISTSTTTKCQRECNVRVNIWKTIDSLIFSFDRLIPILEISDEHKHITFFEQRWVRMYFVLHTIVGWLLAASLLAVASESLGLR